MQQLLQGDGDSGQSTTTDPHRMPMTARPSTLVPMLKALFAVIVWGASFIATKVALQEVSPATVVWLVNHPAVVEETPD